MWEEGEIEDWDEEVATKYFNKIAKYAIQRVMKIKRKQSKERELIDKNKTNSTQNLLKSY